MGRASRYNVGEWYGRLLTNLTPVERRALAKRVLQSDRPKEPCPFRTRKDGSQVDCIKAGGVCSLRSYIELPDGSQPASKDELKLVTTCPNRFYQATKLWSWIGGELLGCTTPRAIGEVPFLRANKARTGGREDVGQIDQILVDESVTPLNWCAVEIQAVYFSGKKMEPDFRLLESWTAVNPPFPQESRRPDFRSSGPKRLMPQLQIKVPTISRWGKRTAVVIDEAFFSALLDEMQTVPDASNADIAWFVVRYEEHGGGAQMVPAFLRFSTLESAVKGLTAGTALTRDEFEDKIRSALSKQ